MKPHKFERTSDHAAVRALVTEQRAYRRMKNDESPDAADLPTELPENLQYIAHWDAEGLQAVFIIDDAGVDTVQIHFCFHPRAWGQTVEIAQAFLDWLWQETGIRAAIGTIPGYNSLALKLALKVGFQEQAREPEAVVKDGRTYDLIVTKIERPAA